MVFFLGFNGLLLLLLGAILGGFLFLGGGTLRLRWFLFLLGDG